MESLITWLMTFGDKAELLEPQEARREIAQMARKITLMYEDKEYNRSGAGAPGAGEFGTNAPEPKREE